MNINEAKYIISKTNKHQRNLLKLSYDRYMFFSGINTYNSPENPPEQIEKDRKEFAYLLKFNERGDPWISDTSCIEFMCLITNLPALLCEAWNEIEFADEHGSIEELIEWSVRQQRKKEYEQEQLILHNMLINNGE